jgi:hypothetical protein
MDFSRLTGWDKAKKATVRRRTGLFSGDALVGQPVQARARPERLPWINMHYIYSQKISIVSRYWHRVNCATAIRTGRMGRTAAGGWRKGIVGPHE